MKPIAWRTQLGLVVGGYAVVFLVSAGLVFARYMQYVRHPDDVATAGGMYAGGDLILGLFIGGLLLVPTFFLLLVLAKSEPAYTLYSKLLLGFSLTAPLSLGLFAIPGVRNGWLPGGFCFYRLVASPLVLVLTGVSRLMARFSRPKKLTLYALLIELATLVLMVTLLFLLLKTHRD